jgi:hypothetical protein
MWGVYMGYSFAPNHKGMPTVSGAQPLVQQFCAHNGIAYSQTSAIGSYRQVLRHLHAVGAPLRQAKGQ